AILHGGDHAQVVPLARDSQVRVQILEYRADVLRQLPDELLAHRPALDGDFREGLDDEFHDRTLAGHARKNRGAEYTGNCSSLDQIIYRRPRRTKPAPAICAMHLPGAFFQ